MPGYLRTARTAVLLLSPLMSACTGAPAQNVLGSFFPAWMLCAAVGIAAAVLLRLLLGAAGM